MLSGSWVGRELLGRAEPRQREPALPCTRPTAGGPERTGRPCRPWADSPACVSTVAITSSTASSWERPGLAPRPVRASPFASSRPTPSPDCPRRGPLGIGRGLAGGARLARVAQVAVRVIASPLPAAHDRVTRFRTPRRSGESFPERLPCAPRRTSTPQLGRLLAKALGGTPHAFGRGEGLRRALGDASLPLSDARGRVRATPSGGPLPGLRLRPWQHRGSARSSRREYVPIAVSTVRGVDTSQAFVEEVTQQLLERILVAAPGQPTHSGVRRPRLARALAAGGRAPRWR